MYLFGIAIPAFHLWTKSLVVYMINDDYNKNDTNNETDNGLMILIIIKRWQTNDGDYKKKNECNVGIYNTVVYIDNRYVYKTVII